MLALNHSITWDKTKSDTEEKSSKFLVVIKILVSFANNISSNKEVIHIGKLRMWIMNDKGPRMDIWWIPCFNVPQWEKEF